MKLLYITNGIDGIGGLERVLSIKLSYFADHLGHEVHVIVLHDKDRPTFYPFSPQITIHPLHIKSGLCSYAWSYMKGINKVVKAVRPDIISVCDDGLKGLYVPLWIKRYGASLIYERHASLRLNNSRLQSFLMKIGGRMYDRLVVLTQYNTTEWRGNNLEVIPNPLSVPLGKTSDLSQKRIICVGSLSYHKGYDMLIKAWGKIANLYPDWKILIYGRGDASVYSDLMREAHVENNLIFCGETHHIEDEMLQASFLVLPSRSEGFGMVLIEAMACGLPCVAFDCPCGPRDIVIDEKNGLLIPPENINALAEGIQKLIENPSLLHSMGSETVKSISKYKIEHIGSVWNTLFNRLRMK